MTHLLCGVSLWSCHNSKGNTTSCQAAPCEAFRVSSLFGMFAADHGARCGTMPLDYLLLVAAGSGTLEGVRLLLAAGAELIPKNITRLAGTLALASEGRYTVSVL